MYSLNVPVPGRVARLASDLFPYLASFDRVRDRHTLVCKRFEATDFDRLRERLRQTLLGSPAFEARVTGIDFFEHPPRGSAPVVYLTVESPGIEAFHGRLVDEFGAIDGLEGDDYVPHITLARGGDVADARRVASQEIDPIEWTVSNVDLYDGNFRETAATISLPG
ncbi:2'-5' RNA ligase family protein [Haloferax sp. MBLA0076]|uniref:2'-5' RNA ligase family protein n=1 Tax=Haloferax litoreum TaxID=2666140 RepID=A0A6A8GFT0_9EURY|nr:MULTISPECIES: 2'-5' RNA ligase family protein [Haloferax]KAB1192857.1 2'-5' RNA ligase family protein [Haloferax sp. CBA1148]MRX21342.1 2'-5' RNA ligase family protein [Haloferax litoreum]